MLKSLVPVFLSLPNPANHCGPRRHIDGATATVSTFATVVGHPNTPVTQQYEACYQKDVDKQQGPQYYCNEASIKEISGQGNISKQRRTSCHTNQWRLGKEASILVCLVFLPDFQSGLSPRHKYRHQLLDGQIHQNHIQNHKHLSQCSPLYMPPEWQPNHIQILMRKLQEMESQIQCRR